jgi:hypothetical protein
VVNLVLAVTLCSKMFYITYGWQLPFAQELSVHSSAHGTTAFVTHLTHKVQITHRASSLYFKVKLVC